MDFLFSVIPCLVIGMVSLVAAVVAALFTDAQWADVQSFLNFCVILFLTYQANRARRVAATVADTLPAEAAERTAQALTGDEHRDDLVHVIADALAERRRKVDR